jgi:hypothetical protein
MDYLYEREMQVVVGDAMSDPRKLATGCIQGSVLGPRLFSMYGRLLEEFILDRDARIVTFADDSYVIIEAEDIQTLKEKSEECLKDHDAFLKTLGMCTNTSKTEATVFNKEAIELSLEVEGQKITTGRTIKVLGITFSYNLGWSAHVEKMVSKAASISNRIKFIRQTLSQEQTLKVLTSYYYASIYYGSAVWLGAVSTSNDWKLMNRAHYRALRIVTRDYRNELNRKSLDKICKRATPRQWSYYATSSAVITITQNKEPSLLHDLIMTNCTTNERKPGVAAFFDTSRRKIGRQSIHNRIGETFKRINFGWLGIKNGKATVRRKLKSVFFPYFNDSD